MGQQRQKVNAKAKPKKAVVDTSQEKDGFSAIMTKEYDIPNNNKDDFRFFIYLLILQKKNIFEVSSLIQEIRKEFIIVEL